MDIQGGCAMSLVAPNGKPIIVRPIEYDDLERVMVMPLKRGDEE